MATLPPPDDSATAPPRRWYLTEEQRQVILAALSGPPRMTFEEFLDWADEDTLAEWVKGTVVMASPASLKHQEIVEFLAGVLSRFGRQHHLGRTILAPFLMKFAETAREPDVIFVATAHLDRLTPTYLDGPADLVVEVLSPESVGRDRGDKFYEYEQAGIPEYWLIDPLTQRAEFYQLDEGGQYQTIGPDHDGVYYAKAVPGLALRIAWLWEPLLPLPEDALAEFSGQR